MARTKIPEDIFLALRRRILSGELQAGTRLPPERELASTLDTNRNTLREAIRKLEQARLVTVRQGQGVTIRDFRKAATIEILEPYLEHGSDPVEKVRCLSDLLASRIQVLEYAMTLAVERATDEDFARLRGITQMLVSAFEVQDRRALSNGFQQWLDALVDAAHSLPARWVANPFLELNRGLTERFPALWVLDSGFADYLSGSLDSLVAGDVPAAIAVTRAYYQRIDGVILSSLRVLLDGTGLDPLATSTDPTKD